MFFVETTPLADPELVRSNKFDAFLLRIGPCGERPIFPLPLLPIVSAGPPGTVFHHPASYTCQTNGGSRTVPKCNAPSLTCCPVPYTMKVRSALGALGSTSHHRTMQPPCLPTCITQASVPPGIETLTSSPGVQSGTGNFQIVLTSVRAWPALPRPDPWQPLLPGSP